MIVLKYYYCYYYWPVLMQYDVWQQLAQQRRCQTIDK